MLIDRDIEDIIDDDGGDYGTIHCYYLTLRSWLDKRVFINNVFNGYLYTALFHFEEDKKNIQSPTGHRVSDTLRAIFCQKGHINTITLSKKMSGMRA